MNAIVAAELSPVVQAAFTPRDVASHAAIQAPPAAMFPPDGRYQQCRRACAQPRRASGNAPGRYAQPSPVAFDLLEAGPPRRPPEAAPSTVHGRECAGKPLARMGRCRQMRQVRYACRQICRTDATAAQQRGMPVLQAQCNAGAPGAMPYVWE